MVLAVAVPPLLAINFPPSATFLNQAAALVGWSVALLLLAPALQARPRPGAGAAALLGALALSALACLASMLWRGQALPGEAGSLNEVCGVNRARPSVSES